MYLFLLQDSNTVFFPTVPFMCGYENTFNHHQSSCSLLTTYLMSGNICGNGLNKKQGVNEEKEQFIVIRQSDRGICITRYCTHLCKGIDL